MSQQSSSWKDYKFQINKRKGKGFNHRRKNPIDVESLNGDITEQEATGVLTVRKPDLLGNSKWQFKFLGKTINADIEDENFLKKVKEKEISFPLVSKLNAKMRVRLKNGDPISYTVIEVKSYE